MADRSRWMGTGPGFAGRLAVCLGLGWLILVAEVGCGGCGRGPSHHDTLQGIMQDRSLNEAAKLERLAEHIFDLTRAEVSPVQPSGFAAELQVKGPDDSVIRQVTSGKSAAETNRALKEFHFKSLNPQLANYLRRAQDLHLQQLTVSLLVNESSGGGDAAAEKYRLILKRDDFQRAMEAATLPAREALPTLERLWQVQLDGFR